MQGVGALAATRHNKLVGACVYFGLLLGVSSLWGMRCLSCARERACDSRTRQAGQFCLQGGASGDLLPLFVVQPFFVSKLNRLSVSPLCCLGCRRWLSGSLAADRGAALRPRVDVWGGRTALSLARGLANPPTRCASSPPIA